MHFSPCYSHPFPSLPDDYPGGYDDFGPHRDPMAAEDPYRRPGLRSHDAHLPPHQAQGGAGEHRVSVHRVNVHRVSVHRGEWLQGWVSTGVSVHRGECPQGWVSTGWVSTGWVSTGVSVHRGEWLQGWVSTGVSVHRGECPQSECPQGWVVTGVSVHRGECPQGECPQGWVVTGVSVHRVSVHRGEWLQGWVSTGVVSTGVSVHRVSVHRGEWLQGWVSTEWVYTGVSVHRGECPQGWHGSGGGFFFTCDDLWGRFDESLPVCAFNFFLMEISLCTLIPLFQPGSVGRGSVCWGDWMSIPWWIVYIRIISAQHSLPTLTSLGQGCMHVKLESASCAFDGMTRVFGWTLNKYQHWELTLELTLKKKIILFLPRGIKTLRDSLREGFVTERIMCVGQYFVRLFCWDFDGLLLLLLLLFFLGGRERDTRFV